MKNGMRRGIAHEDLDDLIDSIHSTDNQRTLLLCITQSEEIFHRHHPITHNRRRKRSLQIFLSLFENLFDYQGGGLYKCTYVRMRKSDCLQSDLDPED
jgi:hypothetical protein